jgi:3-deoxy-7-phosphoheptulonate synthase
MIYSFHKNDPRHKNFLTFLTENGLDFEKVERDKTVFRVFGNVSEKLQTSLDSLSGRITEQNPFVPEAVETAPLFSRGEAPVIAGPCAVESREQLEQTAGFLSGFGIRYLRAGAFKPRTNSGSFQGLGRRGLEIISAIARRFDMSVVTELMDRSQLDDVAAHADIIQVGSRNMFNYSLLTALGAVSKPVLLKRGMAATIDEWVQAADYVRKGGNENVVLCERGIRTFEPRTRFTLDLLAIPVARRLTGLPVFADVSHAAGHSELVTPLARAALAGGADGIMIEVHPDPGAALSDGEQSLDFLQFRSLYEQIGEFCRVDTTAPADGTASRRI